jgi:membrane protein DedA with SNARE-associated domain
MLAPTGRWRSGALSSKSRLTLMSSFDDQLLNLIKDHHVWAGPAVGPLAFGESIAVVGVLLPGTPVLIVIGGLVGSGILAPVPVLVGAILGAVLGDAVGASVGQRAVRSWPLIEYRRRIGLARLFFRRSGFASVFFGRFFGPVRFAVPLVAAMMGMNWRWFQLANAASAIVWAPVVLSPGWLLGRGAENSLISASADWLGLAVVAGGLVAVVAALTITLIRRGTASRRRLAEASRRIRLAPARMCTR